MGELVELELYIIMQENLPSNNMFIEHMVVLVQICARFYLLFQTILELCQI